MIPVNICRQNKIRTGLGRGPALQGNRLGQLFDALSADGWNRASAEDLGREENHHFINDSGAQRAESQIRPAFHQEALDLAPVKLSRKGLEGSTIYERIGKLSDAPATIENNA